MNFDLRKASLNQTEKWLASGFLAVLVNFVSLASVEAQFKTSYARREPGTSTVKQSAPLGPAGVYPQFRSGAGVIHWVKDQMPLKVYLSHGLTLDSIVDSGNVPLCNVKAIDHWPDVAASVLENPEHLKSLNIAAGYNPSLYDAALQGINSWKAFENEGLFSFVLTDDPSDADIYVFWVNHFVNDLGLGLFQNDIRGYTAKRSFWYREILKGKPAQFKPVVIMLRTTDSASHPMPFNWMKSSAAHEFGHALGIEGHSANPHDLMSIYYGNGAISANDAATIRYLYHTPPDLIP